MDYRIFTTHTWSFLCVRMYTQGLGTPTVSQHNILDSEKLLTQTGFKPPVFGSWVRRLTNWATPSHNIIMTEGKMYFCTVNSRVVICTTHWQQTSKQTALPCHEHIIIYNIIWSFQVRQSVQQSSSSSRDSACNCNESIIFIEADLSIYSYSNLKIPEQTLFLTDKVL